jgi:hypothetical protein
MAGRKNFRRLGLAVAVTFAATPGVVLGTASGAQTVKQGYAYAALCGEQIRSGKPVTAKTLSNCAHSINPTTSYRCPNGHKGVLTKLEPSGQTVDLHVGKKPVYFPKLFTERRVFKDC